MASEVVLLSFRASPFGFRVQIAMAEKGVAYEFKEETPFNKSQLLLTSNPVHKKVPVLLHDGKILCESNIIVQYIDEVWSDRGPALLPQDPYQRANARFWADYIDKKLFECGAKVWRSNGEAQAEATRELVGVLKQLEEELGEKQFFGGDAIGYVDVALIAFAGWLQAYERFGGSPWQRSAPSSRSGRGGAWRGEASPRSFRSPKGSTTSSAPLGRSWDSSNMWNHAYKGFGK